MLVTNDDTLITKEEGGINEMGNVEISSEKTQNESFTVQNLLHALIDAECQNATVFIGDINGNHYAKVVTVEDTGVDGFHIIYK